MLLSNTEDIPGQRIVGPPELGTGGADRVRRGGSWDLTAGFLRAAGRFRYPPGIRVASLGFRLARSLD